MKVWFDRTERTLRRLTQRLSESFRLSRYSPHGPTHWARVERYGLYLASRESGVNPIVVRLFAVLHDSQRFAEGSDPEHGPRAAQKVLELANELPLDENSLELLFVACRDHTVGRFHEDPTVAACWDADRLDLDRVAIEPDPAKLNTRTAKMLASYDGPARRRLVLAP